MDLISLGDKLLGFFNPLEAIDATFDEVFSLIAIEHTPKSIKVIL